MRVFSIFSGWHNGCDHPIVGDQQKKRMKYITYLWIFLILLRCTGSHKELKDLKKFGEALNAVRVKRQVSLINDQLVVNYKYSANNHILVFDSNKELTEARPILWRKVIYSSADSLPLEEIDFYRKRFGKDSIIRLSIGYKYRTQPSEDPWSCQYSGFDQISKSPGDTITIGVGKDWWMKQGGITLQQADSILATWGINRINNQ